MTLFIFDLTKCQIKFVICYLLNPIIYIVFTFLVVIIVVSIYKIVIVTIISISDSTINIFIKVNWISNIYRISIFSLVRHVYFVFAHVLLHFFIDNVIILAVIRYLTLLLLLLLMMSLLLPVWLVVNSKLFIVLSLCTPLRFYHLQLS